MNLTDAEWDDLRSENMYDTEEGVRRYVDRLLVERMAAAWDEGEDAGYGGARTGMGSGDNPYRKAKA